MSFKIFLTAFATVLVAELGDKTQLAALALASGSASKWSVFAGACLALIATTAIAVLAAGFLERHLPVEWIKRGAGVLFIGMGLLLLIGTHAPSSDEPPADSTEQTPGS